MTSKLSFRARALDATKALPIYRDTEIPETADCSAINRTVPQMPTGMEKEEESEHHLQQAICTGTTIPTPEVFTIDDLSMYNLMYPADYKTPRQLIYMQPFSMEADIPDYDMDSEDEVWISGQSIKLELTANKFEEMMDRLEKGSGQTVVTLQEAKALIKEDDDLIIAVYDYWLTKRLKTQHHLIPQVRTEARHGVSNHNPYIAFRRRTEKMQTRKNRKNDESSYEKMLKLRRDLARAVTILEMVKRREKSKRELLHLSVEVYEKRYQAGDFSGQIINEALSQRQSRPAFTPLHQGNHLPWIKDTNLLASLARKEKRHYKKRRHKSASKTPSMLASGSSIEPTTSSQSLQFADGDASSDEEVVTPPSEGDEEEEEGSFPFRRRLNCSYNIASDSVRSPPRCSNVEDGTGDKLSFFPASTNFYGQTRYIGTARRRFGRGGRMMIDRGSRNSDDFWRSLGYDVYNSGRADVYQSTSEALVVGHPPLRDAFVPCISDIIGKPIPDELLEQMRNRPTHTNSSISDDDPSQRSRKSTCTEVNMNEEDSSIPRIGAYMGAITSKDDEPMIFSVGSLLQDPEPHKDTTEAPYFLCGDLNERLIDTTLLDKDSADLCNMHVLNTPELQGVELDWFDLADLCLFDPSTPPSDFLDSDMTPETDSDPPTIKAEVPSESSSNPTFPMTEEDHEPCSVTSSQASTVSVNVVVSPERYLHHSHVEPMDVEESCCSSSSVPVINNNGIGNSHLPEENMVVAETSGDVNGINIEEKRRTLDKDDKENSRISLTSKPRVIAGTGGDEEIIVENGNGDVPIITTSEEQKPTFLLTSKTWKHLTA